mgnify:CR=1 FL=1
MCSQRIQHYCLRYIDRINKEPHLSKIPAWSEVPLLFTKNSESEFRISESLFLFFLRILLLHVQCL